MRSGADVSRRASGIALVGVLLVAAAMEAQSSRPAAAADTRVTQRPAGASSDADVERALEAIRADPQLAPLRTMKTLRWRQTQAPRPAGKLPGWLSWIGGLFAFVAESTRVVIWGVLIVLVAVAAAYVVHALRRQAAAEATGSFITPTHVRDLDIRPETLPDDIGSAARTLWDRGDHRAALALLYRGLLSRLVHVHQVPIRYSSTEGDCLALAHELTGDRRAFVGSLITVWQRAVYGREPIDPAVVYRLCDGFATSLDRAGTIHRPAWPASS